MPGSDIEPFGDAQQDRPLRLVGTVGYELRLPDADGCDRKECKQSHGKKLLSMPPPRLLNGISGTPCAAHSLGRLG